ncbi:MAG: two component, sigma54 specific, transcriptional regulator, Fis family [Chitinophagaceae bacterium]|nr:two component, sigma54 specific, transcriptional regulator, Fis family [Chitinophagaceae bacterium]
MTGNILIIDDEEALRKLLSRIISLEGFHVEQATTLKEGLQILSHKNIDVILCDVKLPDGNGVDFVKEAKQKYYSREFILLTAYGNIPDGVQAIKNGAFDYITKGNDNDRIIPLLNMAMDKVLGQRKLAVTIKESGTYNFESIIGTSRSIKETINLAKKIAQTDTTVLLLGETGTGKEVFANAIHANSKRSGKSFVAINCSAFTKDLLEGELFGHKAGAYTGATKDKKGLIEMADGGTLLLDEVGELHIELQAKLLRVLENGEFIKLGDTKTMKVDIRIIAATNRDLSTEVKNGNFREDLYYRLNVFTIPLPPLRERPEDIPALVDYFLSFYTQKEKRNPVHLSKEAMQLLQHYSWKGNIRELRNILQRSIILTDGDEIQPAQLPFEIQQEHLASSHSLALANVEKDHIQKVLLHTKGNKTRTAELLGIGLTTLYRKMEEYHISSVKI